MDRPAGVGRFVAEDVRRGRPGGLRGPVGWRELMLKWSCARTCAFAMLLVGATALPATGQVTTGTVSGTVKDTQGGVIPGATVLLISETQGTKSTPVVTSEIGAFVFANVRADTYTIEV